MKKLWVGIVGAVMLLSMAAGPAGAHMFDLKFQSSGGVCTAGATTCSAAAGGTVLVDVVITLTVDRIWMSTSVGLDLSAMGLAAAAVTGTGFHPPFPVEVAMTLNGVVDPVGASVPAAPYQSTSCLAKLAGCDHRFTSFGFASFTSGGSGVTYTAGTITLNLTGANPGTFTIATYEEEGVDFPDNANNPHNAAILTLVPEPATAALLGVGLLGLATVARRRRARSPGRQPGA